MAAVATIVAIAALLPNHSPSNAQPTRNEGPAQLASSTPPARLTKADRRAIDATLDAFVPAGMARRDVAAAWALSGPELRSGSTLAGWRSGNTPIPYVVPRERTFHDWQTIDVGKRYVIFNLLVHPRNRRAASSYVFSGEVVKHGRRWLVNRVYTIAIMKPPTHTGLHEVGPADFAAQGSSSVAPPSKPLLGRLGILPAVAIFALVLLIPIGVGVVALLRARRWRRLVRKSDRTTLPPLPSGYLRSPEERREPAGKR